MLGVVVGLAAEARLARRLGLVTIGGGISAEAAAQGLVARGVDALVSFGLAGGLDPALPAGTIVVPGCVLADGAHLPTDAALSVRLADGARVCTGNLLAWGRVVADAAEKQRLWRSTGAVAVDMESGAVAQVAAAASLPCAVLRVICDPAGRSLPPAALTALDQGGAIGLGRVLASVLRRPGQVPALLGLARDAVAARRALIAHVTLLAGDRA